MATVGNANPMTPFTTPAHANTPTMARIIMGESNAKSEFMLSRLRRCGTGCCRSRWAAPCDPRAPGNAGTARPARDGVVRAGDEIAVDGPARRVVERLEQLARVAAGETEIERRCA